MKRQPDFEDDGRTIADMSGVDRRTPLGYVRSSETPRRRRASAGGESKASPISREQRRAYVGGALGAALLIGGVFAACGGLAIWLMTVIWSGG